MDQGKMKIVYVISKRGTRNYWTRVGVAFVNRDGSLNVKLEAIPISGDIQIRDYVPRDDAPSSHLDGFGGHHASDSLPLTEMA